MSYAIRNDRQGWRAVNGPDDVGADEYFSETPIEIAPDPKAATGQQISELESQVTPRRWREALLTGDFTFIESVDTQIAALRAAL